MIIHTDVHDLIGAELLDSASNKVGNIGQVYVEDGTGVPEWAIVNTGFFGMNESFLPLAQAERAGNAVRVPYEKATINNAPSLAISDGRPEESQERELYAYYGLDFADHRSDSGLPSGQALGTPTQTTARRGTVAATRPD